MAKLVAVGDSLVQGAMSLAVSDTRNSFTTMVARSLGLSDMEFSTPNFMGSGGLPFNLEWMARILEQEFGEDISLFEWPRAVYRIGRMLDDVEEYWEQGRGAMPLPDQLYHNLGVFGFQVADTCGITPGFCDERIGGSRDEWMQPPSYGWLRIARRVLNPAGLPERQGDTQLAVAQRIAQRDGEVENLLVCVGANNCLNTVYRLLVLETGSAPPGPDSGCTLWSEEAFAPEYRRLAAEIDEVGAKNVFLCTVPRVLDMPLARGIMADRGALPADRDYFDFYTRPWLDTDEFDPGRDLSITGLEAREIDRRQDAYNRVIREIADERGYHVVDLCRVVEQRAWYRHHGNPPGHMPEPIADLDSRFMRLGDNGALVAGGLFSLDGMHPTLCGYGLLAQACVEAIRATGQAVRDVDFRQLRRLDTLVSTPPRTLGDIMGMLRTLETHFHFSRWLRLSIDTGIGIR